MIIAHHRTPTWWVASQFCDEACDCHALVFHMPKPDLIPILFVWVLASKRAVLYGYVTVLIVVLSSTKRYSSSKKGFRFSENFKFKVLKRFKISSDCHVKECQCQKCKQCLVPFFRRTYALSVGFIIKLLGKSIF